MATIDYKEKYEQALERAMQFSEKPYLEDSAGIVGYIFPELKESEDERIRKEITELVMLPTWETETEFYRRKELVAWLEKQGQKPEKVSIWKHWKNGIAGNGEGKLIYLVKSGGTYRLTSSLAFECDYIELSELDKLMQEEKQGEQKCNEEYNITGIKSKNAEGKLGEMIMNLKSVNEVLEQKPAEWSEEDEKLWLHDDDIILDAAKMIVIESPRRSYGGVHKNEIVPWLLSLKERLKSIRPQNTWKRR